MDLGSAQAGATTKKEAACSYEMEGYTNVFNGIRTDWLGIATQNEVSRSFANLLTQPIPCYHGNLMRNMDLALEQLGYIADDVQSRIPATKVVTIRPWVDGSEANPNRGIDGKTATKASCSGSNVAGRADAFGVSLIKASTIRGCRIQQRPPSICATSVWRKFSSRTYLLIPRAYRELLSRNRARHFL